MDKISFPFQPASRRKNGGTHFPDHYTATTDQAPAMAAYPAAAIAGQSRHRTSYRALFRSLLLSLIFFGAPKAMALQCRVLFLGNSYTAVNDLPSLVKNLALSTGDQLIYSANTPGGYTFQQHSSDPASLALIMQGSWDYVVLQEQSQRPAFPDAQVAAEVYPYAKKLDSLVKAYNPCAKTIFYMTWGRKNGDPQNCAAFPPLCSYLGMDSLLQLRYTIMAEDNQAVISPVARLWRTLRATQPGIELYSGDESHPSLTGSYAAACSFYSIIFRKNPVLCFYTASLSAANATIVKTAAKQTVYDSLSYWYRFNEAPVADFTYSITGNTVAFSSNIPNASPVLWNFGDGGTATVPNPSHTYALAGTFPVTLATMLCGRADTIVKSVTIGTTGIRPPPEDRTIHIFPNPAYSMLHLQAAAPISTVRIYDLSGRLMLQTKSPGKDIRDIDLSRLKPALYHIAVETPSGSSHARFSKQ